MGERGAVGFGDGAAALAGSIGGLPGGGNRDSVAQDKDGGAARVHLRNGSTLEVAIPAKSSLLFDTQTGVQLL